MCESGIIELRNDYKSHNFSQKTSNQIAQYLETIKCRNKKCGGDLNIDQASFYQHSEGWKLTAIKEKVWIWFTCKKCGDQCGINYLGVSRNTIIKV